MSVRDFEDMTKERLKLLHIIDRVCGYDTHLAQVTDKDFKSKVATDFGIQAQFSDPTWQSFGLRQPTQYQDQETFFSEKREFHRRDSTSHYALVLAFCKAREALDWFLKQEQRLFIMRFSELSPAAQDAFF